MARMELAVLVYGHLDNFDRNYHSMLTNVLKGRNDAVQAAISVISVMMKHVPSQPTKMHYCSIGAVATSCKRVDRYLTTGSARRN